MINQVNNIAMEKQNRKPILNMIFTSHLYLQKLESTPRDYGTGDLLYSSDIHTVAAIALSPGCNLTKLAEMLSISKAAASKFVAKLIGLGYLLKSKRLDTGRDVIFNLTPKGQAAVLAHEKFVAETFGPLLEIEASLSGDEYQVISGYFEKIDKAAKRSTASKQTKAN